MKFRDPETGRVFEDIEEACHAFCLVNCDNCPMSYVNNAIGSPCVEYRTRYPAEAAKLMGYEVLEDSKVVESDHVTAKPLSQWTLGEAREECKRHDVCMTCPMLKHNAACMLLDEAAPRDWNLSDKPRWTEADVEDAKAIMRVTGMVWAGRDEDGELWAYAEEPILVDNTFESRKNYIWMRSSILPSLAHGEKVKLEDILAQVPHV